MDRHKKGFTLMETVIVLALFAVLTGILISSTQYMTVSKKYEKKVVQYVVEDALVGYYGMMGAYPIDSSRAGSLHDYVLTEAEVKNILKDLNMYVGYSLGQENDIRILMRRYDFVVSFPSEYILRVKVVDK